MSFARLSYLLGTVALAFLPGVSSGAIIGTLQQIAPVPTSYTADLDFKVFGTIDDGIVASGDVTARVSGVDLLSLDSGCQIEDFAGFMPGSIALIRRGTCEFSTKVGNALAAGAVGALIFDNTNTFPNVAFIDPTFIPALFLTDDLGLALVASLNTGLTVHLAVADAQSVPEPTVLGLLIIGIGAIAVGRRRRPVAARR